LELYYRGFLDLATHRQIGSTLGWIPAMAILDYCDRIELEGDQREDFVSLVKRLDYLYLEWTGKRGNKQQQPRAVRGPNEETGRSDKRRR